MTTTARADAVAHIRAVLVARKATSPTLLRAVYNARPGSFPETPCAYIGPRDETISITSQIKTRQFSGLSVVVVDALQDASEEADRMDVLVDLLVGDFMASRNLSGGGGRLYLGSVSDVDVTTQGPTTTSTYRGAVLGFAPSNVQEGLEASA